MLNGEIVISCIAFAFLSSLAIRISTDFPNLIATTISLAKVPPDNHDIPSGLSRRSNR